MNNDSTSQEHIHADFESSGFAFTPPVYSADEIVRVNAAVDAVLQGEYETGVAPFHAHDPAHLTQPLVKIDNTQLANRTILSFLTDPRFGEWAARVSGAKRVQIWSSQLLVKRPSTKPTSGGVGWHRDETYWKYWTPDSELFTAWIALTDVQAESGPMCMVPGSHRWSDSGGGDFFGGDLDAVKKGFAPPAGEDWQEVPMILPPGAMSFHHKRTIHGSYANTSKGERRSFAVHMRTEKSQVRADAYPNPYIDRLDDHERAPVIWDASN